MAYCIKVKNIFCLNKKATLRQTQGSQNYRWMTMRWLTVRK